MNRCRKREAEELPLWQIFDEVCRSRPWWQRLRFCHHWKFDVRMEGDGYAKFAYRSMGGRRKLSRVYLCRWEMNRSTTVQ